MSESTEYWLPVVGYEGLYEISDQGRIRSLSRPGKTGRILKQRLNTTGYLQVSLSKEAIVRTRKIHKIVAEAFLGPCPEGMEVLHGDGIKTNVVLTNLRYGTRSENMQDVVRHGQHNYASRTECGRCGGPYSWRSGGRNGKKRRYCVPCNSRRR